MLSGHDLQLRHEWVSPGHQLIEPGLWVAVDDAGNDVGEIAVPVRRRGAYSRRPLLVITGDPVRGEPDDVPPCIALNPPRKASPFRVSLTRIERRSFVERSAAR